MKKMFLVIAIFAMVGLFSAPAFAANQNWIGGSVANGDWGNVDNWSGGAVPDGAGIFNAAIANTWGNASGNPVVIDSAAQNTFGIYFTGAAGNYFIGSTGGNSLLLAGGNIIQIDGSLSSTNAVETINAPIVLEGGGGTIQNNSANGAGGGAGTLNIGGGITGGAAGIVQLALGGSNTNLNTVSGIIANGSATPLEVIKQDG